MLVVARLGPVLRGRWIRAWPDPEVEEIAAACPRLVRVRVGDDQMLPWLRADDDVLVAIGLLARPGDVVVAAHRGRVLVRVLQERPRGWYLAPVRGSAKGVLVDQRVAIVGVVVEVAYRP